MLGKRATMRNEGTLTQREVRRLGRRIAASLKEDCKEQAWKAGEAIILELGAGNTKEAWRLLKAWHREAGGMTIRPCYASMKRQTEEREDLYGFQVSPGEHMPINRDPILLPNKAPPDADIRAAVKRLRNGRTGGGTMMRTEDIKAWLARTKEEEEAEGEATGSGGLERARDTLRLLVRLIQHIWDMAQHGCCLRLSCCPPRTHPGTSVGWVYSRWCGK